MRLGIIRRFSRRAECGNWKRKLERGRLSSPHSLLPPVSAKPGFLLNPSACAKRGRRGGGGNKEKKGRKEKKASHRNVSRDLASFRLLSPEYPGSRSGREAAAAPAMEARGKQTGKRHLRRGCYHRD